MKRERRRLNVDIYTSGSVGRGKPKKAYTTSILTPTQWERRFYGGAFHFRTEAAVDVRYAKRKKKRR